jgi:hypothetical protein
VSEVDPLAGGVIGFVPKEHVRAAGSPWQESVTGPLNPPNDVTLYVLVVEPPDVAIRSVGAGWRAKSRFGLLHDWVTVGVHGL